MNDILIERSEFRVGRRVQLHPATDRWMRGDRYGAITKVSDLPDGRLVATILMDVSGKTLRFTRCSIFAVFD